MAGHLALSKQDEPKLFELIQENKLGIILAWTQLKDFQKGKTFKGLDVMRLSPEYFELSKEQSDNGEGFAVTVGKVSLEGMTDEADLLTQDINVEVHFGIKDKTYTLLNIFWVA